MAEHLIIAAISVAVAIAAYVHDHRKGPTQ
jgi:hypothetical protein